MKNLGIAKLRHRPSAIAQLAGTKNSVRLTESLVFDPRTGVIHLAEINEGIHITLNAEDGSLGGATIHGKHLAGIGLTVDLNTLALVRTHHHQYLDWTTGEVIEGQKFEAGNTRGNHVTVDPWGNLGAASLGLDFANPSPVAGLHRFIDGIWQRELDLSIGNGWAYTPDRKSLLVTDSALGGQGVMMFDVNPATGNINFATKRLFAVTCGGKPYPQALPDGLWIGGDGKVWVAEWGCSCITVYNPDGSVYGVVAVETHRPTHSVLVGRRLFVTSEWIPGDVDRDEAGGIFIADLDEDFAPGEPFYCQAPAA